MTETKILWTGFSHLTFPVHDLNIAEEFYVGLLGGKLLEKFDRKKFLMYRPGDEKIADAANSPLHLTIAFGESFQLQLFLQPKNIQQVVDHPHPHLALHIEPENLMPAKARLVASGVVVDGPLRLGPPGHASLYFFDPFGNHLELETMGLTEGVEMRAPNHQMLKYDWKS